MVNTHMRSAVTVMLEAIVIGVMNALIIIALEKIRSKTDMKKIKTWVLHFVSGALIHVLFEVFGGNEWWCLTTYK